MISRRRFLVASCYAAIVGSYTYGRYLEPYALEVTHVPFSFTRVRLNGPVRWVHISDFHAFDLLPFSIIEDTISLALFQDPDFICITGDFVTSRVGNRDQYIAALRRLTERVPTYAVMGNHDGGYWSSHTGGARTSYDIRTLLEESNVRVLHNESELVTIRNSKLQLVGVGDIWAREFDPDAAIKKSTNDYPVIMLSHNPDSKSDLQSYEWDLMLCGHTHGGQLTIPVMGDTPLAPVRDHRYVAGLNPWEDRWIYTNRGIGSISGIRVNCRPEVTVFNGISVA